MQFKKEKFTLSLQDFTKAIQQTLQLIDSGQFV